MVERCVYMFEGGAVAWSSWRLTKGHPAITLLARPCVAQLAQVLERLEFGVAAWQPPARSAARDRCCYLPRAVFFGRLGFAGAFFSVWASDFERFLPATSDSFPVDVLPGTLLR